MIETLRYFIKIWMLLKTIIKIMSVEKKSLSFILIKIFFNSFSKWLKIILLIIFNLTIKNLNYKSHLQRYALSNVQNLIIIETILIVLLVSFLKFWSFFLYYSFLFFHLLLWQSTLFFIHWIYLSLHFHSECKFLPS